MLDFMTITKALADEHRVRALLALHHRPLCVCQVIQLLGLAASTVSRHMSILRQARLVESWKEGRWVHYRLAGDDAPPAVRAAIAWVVRSLADHPQTLQDSRRLAEIVRIEAEGLCECQQEARCECAPADQPLGVPEVEVPL